MTTIADNLQAVHERMLRACQSTSRKAEEVCLLAVSKTFGVDAIREAFSAGQRSFGENYIQEGVDKIAELTDLPIEWHCIGPVQSNKTRLVATHFHWVQSVDRLKIAQRLSDQRSGTLPPLQVCIQVNIDDGANKSGVTPDEALELAKAVAALPNLRLRGIMCIPEPTDEPLKERQSFEAACTLFGSLKDAGLDVDTLSMGMSDDVEAAIACGSTMVRVGTAIFGKRDYGTPES